MHELLELIDAKGKNGAVHAPADSAWPRPTLHQAGQSSLSVVLHCDVWLFGGFLNDWDLKTEFETILKYGCEYGYSSKRDKSVTH